MLPFFLFPRRYSVCVNTYGNHIAIIGGGIAGLALGIMLKKNNIPNQIITSGGINLDQLFFRILKHLI